MESVNKDYLGKHKKFRTDSKGLAAVFLVSAIVVAIVVFWWLKLVGITVTGEAFCGLDEHTHNDDCYVSEVICGFDGEDTGTLPSEAATVQEEAVTQETTVTDAPEDESEISSEAQESTASSEAVTEPETVTKEIHTHTDECYKKTLICTKTEHAHTQDCFPDKTADVETVSDWLSTLDKIEITNNIPENLIAVAMSQMGYEESSNNFEYDNEGNKNGYTRYGEWYGNPYGKWNAMFVSFCLHYSNVNNDSELKSAGAEALRLAWQNRYVYSPADNYTAQRGDIVFLDSDADGTSDTVGIITATSETKLTVIMGDSNNKVESLNIDINDKIIGYGLTGELSFAKDMEYHADDEQVTDSEQTTDSPTPDVQFVPPLMMSASPSATEDDHTIKYITDLTEAVTDVTFKTQDGAEIPENGTVYIGQKYIVALTFSETNSGNEWIQFSHNDEHYLIYPLPDNLECEPFDTRHDITAEMENGSIQKVGEYFVGEDGNLYVKFIDVEPGVCFGQKYSNVEFTIDFNVTIGATQSGESSKIEFGNEVDIELNVDGGAGMDVTKTHGEYDEDNHTMEYIIRVEATHGVVKDLVIDDQIWDTHNTLRDTIVVTDLKGNIIDPQPTVSNHPKHNQGANEGFRISGFPDFPAGEGFLITYKTQIYDELIGNESVSLWNGLDSTGKNSNGENIYVWSEDWLKVELEKMEKEGRQTTINDKNGNSLSVIEWKVAIKKDNHNLQGTVIIDTLGDGLAYYQDKPILVKHYDESGNSLPNMEISWDNVTVNGNSMEFPLPDGYQFEIVYYTTYEKLNEGDTHKYTNEVKATINGKEETAGGSADVIGFVPKISKSARGNDGEYVYFTITADVPAVIKDWGNFYLTDLAAIWGYKGNEEGFLYVENHPQDMVITATTKTTNQTITFTPYVPGGPIENTYILIDPADGNQNHSFNVLFNTSQENFDSSKWILSEDAVLTINYKIPFDAKTGVQWQGELTGDKTLEDVLLEGYKFANEVYFNYTKVIQDTASSTYEYSPIITKKSEVHSDGTIDYTVVFNNNIPGTGGQEGYIDGTTNLVRFTDTFDEKLEYVPGSLVVTGYSPWQKDLWLAQYKYNGTISGNTIDVSSEEFLFYDYNENADQYNWNWITGTYNFKNYYQWVNSGGKFVFTYKLKVKDAYLKTTETNRYTLDNTAELLWGNDNTSGPVTDTTEFETGLLDKSVAQDGNKLNFAIHVNEQSLDILKGLDTLTIIDTMTPNLSVYWSSIKLYYQDKTTGEWIDFDADDNYHYSVTYDQDSNTLTFIVPDELHIKIDYSTLITGNGLVSVQNNVSINSSAEVTDLINATFKVQEHSGGATGYDHSITLIKQDGDTNVRLPNVKFHFYGLQGDPHAVVPDDAQKNIYADDGRKMNYIGTYTTGADGTVEIKSQFLTTDGFFALVEAAPPEGYMSLQKPVYFYFYKTDPNGIIQTVTTIIAIENYTYGFVLPETGGTGTLPLAIIGVSLMAFPILYSTIRRKRERRLT